MKEKGRAYVAESECAEHYVDGEGNKKGSAGQRDIQDAFHIAYVYPICGGDGGGDGVRVRKIAFLENSRRVGNFPANPLIVR